MINQRGTEYSRKHNTLNSGSKEYFDVSLTDQWLDIKANLGIVKAYTGYELVDYVGYSGATSQMLFALSSEEPYLIDKVRKVVLLAPCTIYALAPPGSLEIFAAQLEILEIPGANWEADKAKVCSITSKRICESMDSWDGLQPTSLKSNVHIGQIFTVKKFQEYAEDWPSNKKGREIDLTKVQNIPVSLYTAQFDEVCEGWYADQAKEDLDEVLVNFEVETDPIGHLFYA